MDFIRKTLGTVALSATLACQNAPLNNSIFADYSIERMVDSLGTRGQELAEASGVDSLTILYIGQNRKKTTLSLHSYFLQELADSQRNHELQHLILTRYQDDLNEVAHNLIIEGYRLKFERSDSLMSVYLGLIDKAEDPTTARWLLEEWKAEDLKHQN
ncbi:hypothetical protein J4455_01545 [Candidatus Woesearchaeota archaeon]|nr:hypothetical protein [uncultured archaeon]AQS32243.1 hypothetical protein [uncultured archaeon]MBS3149362.1 hypothetical protein [Candidatus Woesearchaeota archaeon]